MTTGNAIGLEVTLSLPPSSLIIRLFVPGAAALPTFEQKMVLVVVQPIKRANVVW